MLIPVCIFLFSFDGIFYVYSVYIFYVYICTIKWKIPIRCKIPIINIVEVVEVMAVEEEVEQEETQSKKEKVQNEEWCQSPPDQEDEDHVPWRNNQMHSPRIRTLILKTVCILCIYILNYILYISHIYICILC